MARGSWAARGITALLLLSISVHALQKDPYKVLGVRRTSSEQEIKQAFRRLSRQWHPDKNTSPGATEKFQEISAAYEFLSDPSRAGQAWDFTGPSTASKGRKFPSYPDAAFYYAHNAYHTVLDLDPLRLLALLSKWMKDKFAKNREVLQPLWTAPVDKAVCKGLATAWRLPQLLEPVLLSGAEFNVFAYEAGQWRSWGASGALLELSFWAARQTPCLRHHSSSSSSSDSEAAWDAGDSSSRSSNDAAYEGSEQDGPSDTELLIELQQTFQQQRLIRQQLLAAEQQKTQSEASNSSKSSSRKPAGSRKGSTAEPDSVVLQDSLGLHVGADELQARQLHGKVLWWMLLTLTACSFRHSKKTITVVWVVTVLGLLYVVGLSWSGEGAAGDKIRDLAGTLEAGNGVSLLIGSWFVVGCFTALIIFPAALATAFITVSVWIWAVVSCISIAIAPCLSRMGAGLWVSLKLWSLTERGDPVRSGLLLVGLAYMLYKKRGLVWSFWLGLLVSPVLFVWHFLRVPAVQTLYWFGLLTPSLSSTAARRLGCMAIAAQQQHQQQNLGPLTAEVPEAAAAKAAAAEGPNPASLQATASATFTTQTSASLKKRKRAPGVETEAVAAAAAVPLPSQEQQHDPLEFATFTSSRKSRSRVRRAAGFVFGGPWCPNGFGAKDLAITCHWWINMLGWELPTRVLVAAAFSIQLTLLVTFAALAVASFGLPINWLTVQLLVTVVTCRVGPVVGLIWVLLKGLDDVARWMDPATHARKRRLGRRPRGRGRL